MLKRVVCVALSALLAIGIFAVLMAQPTKAAEITEMQCSDDLLSLLKEMEGFVAIPKWDYTQWTVGFGSACPNEDLERYKAEGIPPEEAHELMMKHVVKFEKDVNAFMVRNKIQLTQNQFDALVSMVYNLGSGFLYKNESDVIRAVLYGADTNSFLFAIGQYCSAGGEFMYGLLRRRMMEGYMYLFDTYSTTLPSSFCYVRYDANGGTFDARAQGYDTNFAAVPLSVPTREGYIFAGWYTEASGGQKVTVLDASTNGMTLYAHWEAGSFKPENPTDPESGITVTVTEDLLAIRKTAGSSGAVVSYAFEGDKITITGVTKKDNVLWGCFRKGWICLTYTDYYEITGTERPGHYDNDPHVQVPIKITVLNANGVEVRHGPHTSYPQITTLKQGETVVIEEVMVFYNLLWGRYQGGWVRLNQNILLHDEKKLAHDFETTVNYSYLNVRSGPGMNYTVITQLAAGTKVEIMSIQIVDGIYWGRCSTGWIYLDTYTDFDHSKYEQYRSHSYGEWYTIGGVSCAEAGQQRRDCQLCDHYEVQNVQTVEHTLGQWYVYRASTCAQSGEERLECSKCNYYESRPLELKSHDMGDWYVFKESTCVEAGQERRGCSHCDYYETRSLDLGEHKLGQWYVSKNATCVEAGQERRDCTGCDHYEVRATDLVDHSMGQWTQTVAPGCETVGQEQQKCEHCDHKLTREVAATGHSMGQWIQTVAPGCETVGQEQQKCEHCDHMLTREVAATGHSMGDWYETMEPTQEAEGEARRDCANCQHYETKVLDKVIHEYGDWYIVQDSTCTTEGEERRSCSQCDAYESRPIPMKEHSLTEWSVVTEASCSAVGEERRGCSACDYAETREIAMVDHNFGQWTTVTGSTCTVMGEEKRECSGCGVTETRELPLGEHTMGDWQTHVAAGCETAGEERSVCALCQYYESRPTEALGHKLGQWYVFKNASCTANGEERRECESCDHYESREIQQVNHSYGSWNVLTAPTIDAEGQRCRECVHCGEKEYGTLPMLAAVENVYATIAYDSLNVRMEPSTSSTRVGSVNRGVVVKIQELVTVDGKQWGRIEFGWILLTGYATVETVREPAVSDNGEKLYATIQIDTLNVRPTSASSATRVGTLCRNVRVRVYETVVIDQVTWGRVETGWIWLTGYVTLETVAAEHTEHTFDDWYTYQSGNCVTLGQERRDCTGCDHYETRDGQLGGHVYGEWCVTEAATCVAGGQERRNCEYCDHFETRDTAVSDTHSMGQWNVITAPGCESTGLERRECQHCDYAEEQQIAATGHIMGQWNVVTAPGCESAGLERRECQHCAYAEQRQVAAVGHTMGQWNVITAPGCESTGLERRECQHCEYAEEQQMVATGHIFGQWYVVKEATTEQEGQERRDCKNCDHHELRQTEKLPVVENKVYGKFTGTGYLNVRADAGTGNAIVGKLYPNVRVEILEQKTVDGKVWGRIEGGWVMITGYIVLETEGGSGAEPVTKTYGTVSNSSISKLNVRSGAGYGYGVVGGVYYGDRVEILELKTVDGNVWGRIEGGWILITGMVTLETVTE